MPNLNLDLNPEFLPSHWEGLGVGLEKIEYIDTHSHLHDKAFDLDRDLVLENMKKNKIATICIGTDLIESQKAKDLALKNENIFYTVGLHPHDNLIEFNSALENPEDYFQKLFLLISHKCLAIGETGLDYFYFPPKADPPRAEDNLEYRERQKIIFKKHIDLALKLNLPLMLHIRPSEIEGNKEDAYLEAIEILKEPYPQPLQNPTPDPSQWEGRNSANPEPLPLGGAAREASGVGLRGNFHFFVSTKNILQKILTELPEFTVSFSAVCTFSSEYDELIKIIPLNKIHIETDSPFVLPKNRRKLFKRNEPNFVIDVFEKIAELKNINSLEEKENLKNILKNNFQKLYLN